MERFAFEAFDPRNRRELRLREEAHATNEEATLVLSPSFIGEEPLSAIFLPVG
jgi:hypothetical protein